MSWICGLKNREFKKIIKVRITVDSSFFNMELIQSGVRWSGVSGWVGTMKSSKV